MADAAESGEIERLRVRIDDLESELAVQAARVNEMVADTQRRVYWLDQLDLDLNVTLSRPPVRFLVVIPLKLVRKIRRVRGRLRRRLR